MEALLKRQPVDPDRVREMLVRSAPESVVDNSDPPDINIQHAMALMVIDRTVTFRSIHELSRMQDPRVLRLRARVRLEAPAGGGGTGRGAVRLPRPVRGTHSAATDSVLIVDSTVASGGTESSAGRGGARRASREAPRGASRHRPRRPHRPPAESGRRAPRRA